MWLYLRNRCVRGPDEVRPHEFLDFATPLSAYLAESAKPNLFEPESVQES